MSRALVSTVAFATFLSSTALAQSVVGFISSMSGKWTVNGVPVALGQSVVAGTHVILDPASPRGSSIQIYYEMLPPYSCPNENERLCGDVPVKNTPPASSLVARLFAEIGRAFGSPESRPVLSMTRGASIPDGYAIIDAGQLSIHQPPGDSPPDSYALRLRRIHLDGQLDAPEAPILHWRSGNPVVVSGLRPGFFRADLLGALSKPSGDFFLILVLSPADAHSVASEFSALTALSEKWSPADQSSAVLVLRSFLWQRANSLGFR
jgi:hypothetical protein